MKLQIRDNEILFVSDACIGLTYSSLTVAEDSREALACVELQKPSVLMNEKSYVLFTNEGTALGKVYVQPFCLWQYLVKI